MKILSLLLAMVMTFGVLSGCARKEEGDKNVIETTDRVEDTANSENEDNSSMDDKTENGGEEIKDTESSNSGSVESGSANNTSGSDQSSSDTQSTNKDQSSNSSGSDSGSSNSASSDSSKPSDNSSDESRAPVSGYTDGIVLEAYLPVLANHFYKSYKTGDSLKNIDILHITALFLISQRPATVSAVEGDDSRFAVSASQLEKNMQLLFGSDIKLKDHISYLNESLGDSYDSTSDTYSFLKDRENWGGADNELSMSDMEIDENSDSLTAKILIIDKGGKEISVTYKMDKIVDGGYLYFRLSKVTVNK